MAKKTTAKKTTAKKTTAKKTTAKKTTAKKTTAKKTTAKKTTAKKTTAKKTTAKKTTAKKTTAKKTTAKKTTAKKTTAKKTTAKKTTAKKTTAKKTTAKKTTAKKTTAKKTTAQIFVPEVPLSGRSWNQNVSNFQKVAPESPINVVNEKANSKPKNYPKILIALIGSLALSVFLFSKLSSSELIGESIQQNSVAPTSIPQSEPTKDQISLNDQNAKSPESKKSPEKIQSNPNISIAFKYTPTGIRIYWDLNQFRADKIDLEISENPTDFQSFYIGDNSISYYDVEKTETTGKTFFKVTATNNTKIAISDSFDIRGKFKV